MLPYDPDKLDGIDYMLFAYPTYPRLDRLSSLLRFPRPNLVPWAWLIACDRHGRVLPRPIIPTSTMRFPVPDRLDDYWAIVPAAQEVEAELRRKGQKRDTLNRFYDLILDKVGSYSHSTAPSPIPLRWPKTPGSEQSD